MTIPINQSTVSATLLIINIITIIVFTFAMKCKGPECVSGPCKRCGTLIILVITLIALLIWTPKAIYDKSQDNHLKQTLGPKWYEVYITLNNTTLCESRKITIKQIENKNMPPLSIEAFELIGSLLNHPHYDQNYNHNEEWTILKSYIKVLPD